jgi:hypothetical protein
MKFTSSLTPVTAPDITNAKRASKQLKPVPLENGSTKRCSLATIPTVLGVSVITPLLPLLTSYQTLDFSSSMSPWYRRLLPLPRGLYPIHRVIQRRPRDPRLPSWIMVQLHREKMRTRGAFRMRGVLFQCGTHLDHTDRRLHRRASRIHAPEAVPRRL